MSKPDKPGELRDVQVNAISLVGKAANGERFKIYKSAEPEPQRTPESIKSGEPEKQEGKAPEVVEKNELGLFSILKEFFTGTSQPVEKGAVADAYNAQNAGHRLDEAFNALLKVLGLTRWGDSNPDFETDPAKILSAIDDFRNIAIEILIGKEVVKSGRKISTPRLTKLKSIQSMLNEVLSELDDQEETLEEAEELTKEDVKKAVDEAMKAAITSGETLSETGKGGRLNPEQAKKFISYMVDNTDFLKDIRLERMSAPEKQLDVLQISSRLLRKATEALGPDEIAGVNITRKELRSVKVRLAADITTEFDEDNIEGTSGRDRIARDLAKQFGNDIVDLMLNGDTTATGDGSSFLTIGDGIIKQAKDSSDTHKYKLSGTDYKGTIFPGMLALMPNKFKRNRTNMRFYCSSSVGDKYIMSFADRQTALGDAAYSGRVPMQFIDIRVFPVEYIPDDVIILTHKDNLVSGIQRDMQVLSQYNQRKDLTEYTMYMRLDPGKIVWDDALVIAYPF